jgi:hypothetical protein
MSISAAVARRAPGARAKRKKPGGGLGEVRHHGRVEALGRGGGRGEPRPGGARGAQVAPAPELKADEQDEQDQGERGERSGHGRVQGGRFGAASDILAGTGARVQRRTAELQ